MGFLFHEDQNIGRVNLKLTITGVTITLYTLTIFATLILLLTVNTHLDYDFSQSIHSELLAAFSLMN